MRTAQKNNQKFLAQLRRSHAAFVARSADFAQYPVDLADYGSRIAAFESAAAAELRYQTETLVALRSAQAEYDATMASARARLLAAKDAAESERLAVASATRSTRDAAVSAFHMYQNIAEAVYLGRAQPEVLDEFDTPSDRRKSVKPTLPTQAAM